MNQKIIIRVYNLSINNICKFCFNKNINIYKSLKGINYCDLLIDKKDYKLINRYYPCKIMKDYSFKSYINKFKSIYNSILLLIFGIVLFSIFKNIILEVNINTTNKELYNEINKKLDESNIKRLSFKKDYIQLNEIKDHIVKDLKEKLEYLEIESIGMTYNVKIVERKSKQFLKNSGICDIVSTNDAIITKIISESGTILKEKNNYVKTGDTIISGNVSLNDEIKGSVCANGKVYGEVWHVVSISLANSYEKKEYTNKVRYNFEIEANNNDYKILRSRFKNYDSDKKEIISILGYKLNLIKEYEYNLNTYMYSEEELDNKINELIYEKLELNLNDNERIISKNILKKEENNSRINIEIFVSSERLISKQIVYN